MHAHARVSDGAGRKVATTRKKNPFAGFPERTFAFKKKIWRKKKKKKKFEWDLRQKKRDLKCASKDRGITKKKKKIKC
jgi:hypothetical protein